MKFLLSLLMLTSFSIFAADAEMDEYLDLGDEVITGFQAINIKKAIFKNLMERQYNCSEGWGTFSALRSNFNLFGMNDSSAKVTYTESNTSPIVKIDNTANNKATEISFTFNLSLNLARVTSVTYSLTQYSFVEKNVGTVIKPVFEDVRTKTKTEKATCTETENSY